MFNSPTINLHELRKTLFSIAYKMIGEIAASEDMVQDTMAIYIAKSAKKELLEVRDLKKYLIRTVTNRSINYLKKIKQERANYFGCLLYTSPSPRDATLSRMPSSA